jgi:hypothetical protein
MRMPRLNLLPPRAPIRFLGAALCLAGACFAAGGAAAQSADPNTPAAGGKNPFDDPSRPPWHDDPAVPRQQDPKALEVLKAGLKALGGEQAILDRQTIYIVRKITSYDFPEPREGRLTIYFRRPNLFRKEVSYEGNKLVEAYDGQKAWFDDGKGPKVHGPGRTASVLDGIQELDAPANYLDADLTYFNISQEIPGKLAHVVKVRKNGYTRELMFDVSTNLLAIAGEYENPWGATDRMAKYDRYRPVDGVLVPYKVENWRSNKLSSETEILEIKFNGPMDDSLFAYPGDARSGKPAAP